MSRKVAAVAAVALLGLIGLPGCRRPAFLGGHEDAVDQPVVCDGKYALCTAAACTPIPVVNAKSGKIEISQALCQCEVAHGLSLGNRDCAARAPQGDGKFFRSTFSFGDTATHPALTCESGTPWAFCYGSPCAVDPKDPTKALCTCAVRATGDYETLAAGCDKAKCGSVLMVGAPPDAAAEAGKLLAQGLGLKQVPANRCP